MGAWKDWELGLVEDGASPRQIADAEAAIKGTLTDPLARRLAANAGPDPFPVGCRATVLDHDRKTVLGPYLIVRSYWPTPCVELLVEEPHSHMVRQHHDRMTKEAA